MVPRKFPRIGRHRKAGETRGLTKGNFYGISGFGFCDVVLNPQKRREMGTKSENTLDLPSEIQ